MSYQFEDDSALEELLNQQLDRRRQQQKTLAGRPLTGGSNSSSANNNTNNNNTSRVPQPIRPSTSRLNNSNNDNVQSQPPTEKNPLPAAGASANDQSTGPKASKLANWLAADNALAGSSSARQAPPIASTIEDENNLRPTTRKSSGSLATKMTTLGRGSSKIDNSSALKWMQDEDKLQEMSKQRLIQFILEEIQPNLKESMESSELELRQEIDRLAQELEEEKDRHRSREKQQIQLIESKWQQLNKQLETRLEFSDSELREARESQRLLVRELDEEFKRQMKQVSESYQSRLEEEKRSSEEALRRSQELHRLELESKLKVNIELDKLETTFGEWQRMVRLTVGELADQLKAIESLLEKQTLEINTTNVNLTKKSQQLSEQYARFETQTGQLDVLSAKLSEQILPQFSLAQKESQSAIDKMNSELGQLNKQMESIEKSKLGLEEQRRQLEVDKDELSKSRFEVALESSRLGFKEEKLDDLVGKNERTGAQLSEQTRAQQQKELKLERLESSLESKSTKLREQNYELHLIRKRLDSKEEDLARLESELAAKSARLEADGTKLSGHRRRLEELRNRIRRESGQLCRLEKSLICSLCFGRLFDAEQETSAGSKQQVIHMSSARDFRLRNIRHEQFAEKHHGAQEGRAWDNLSDLELAALSDYLESDAKQLESECKYVDMLC